MKLLKTIVLLFSLSVFVLACGSSHTVSITFESNGGNTIATAQVNSDSPQYLPPTPQKTGFVFANWYIDSELTTLYTPDALEDNTELTLYAKYLADDQTEMVIVTFSTIGGTFIPNQVITFGTIPTKPEDPERVNSEFLYWQYYSNVTGSYLNYNFTWPISEHFILYAEYELTTEVQK